MAQSARTRELTPLEIKILELVDQAAENLIAQDAIERACLPDSAIESIEHLYDAGLIDRPDEQKRRSYGLTPIGEQRLRQVRARTKPKAKAGA